MTLKHACACIQYAGVKDAENETLEGLILVCPPDEDANRSKCAEFYGYPCLRVLVLPDYPLNANDLHVEEV